MPAPRSARRARAVITAGSAHSCSGLFVPAAVPTGRANHFSLDDYMKPYLQSARLCGMRRAPSFAVHSAETLTGPPLAAAGLGKAPGYRRPD